MWQTLERKARFIRDVMSPALDAREIGDIGDTVLSFSEAKALATNNPLLMDKAEADAQLARLVRAERAHHRNQDTLRRTITRLEAHIAAQTKLVDDIDAAIGRRQDTRGEAFTMTVGDRTTAKRMTPACTYSTCSARKRRTNSATANEPSTPANSAASR